MEQKKKRKAKKEIMGHENIRCDCGWETITNRVVCWEIRCPKCGRGLREATDFITPETAKHKNVNDKKEE